MSPAVSVIIPTKNRPVGVRNAVASVLAGLPETGELIVVDDASDPPASQSLSTITDPRVRVLVNPGPHGPSAARNFGVRHSSGDVLMFLDDDDLLIEDYPSRVLDRLPSLPDDCVFGFSTAFHLEPGGTPTSVPFTSPAGVLGDETALKYRQAGLGMGCWITRSAFDAIGGLDEAISVNEDTEFSVRLAAAGYRCFCDQTAGVTLIHDHVRDGSDQSSITNAAGARKRYQGFEYILTKHQEFLRRHGTFRRRLFGRVLKYRMRANEPRGWSAFCNQHRPIPEALIYLVFGLVCLGLDVLFKRRTRSAN